MTLARSEAPTARERRWSRIYLIWISPLSENMSAHRALNAEGYRICAFFTLPEPVLPGAGASAAGNEST
jgi:hypothetical protein